MLRDHCSGKNPIIIPPTDPAPTTRHALQGALRHEGRRRLHPSLPAAGAPAQPSLSTSRLVRTIPRPAMTYLTALKARLEADGVSSSGDGYFVRTKRGERIGPMGEREFEHLRRIEDINSVASAWRVAGGTFYKVQLRRKLVWDLSHVLSCRAFHHCFELVTIIFCFAATTGAPALSPPHSRSARRESPGSARRGSDRGEWPGEWPRSDACRAGRGAGAIALLEFSEAKQLKREREEAGPNTLRFLMFLFLLTIVAVIFTVKKLLERWRKVSTDVFISEV